MNEKQQQQEIAERAKFLAGLEEGVRRAEEERLIPVKTHQAIVQELDRRNQEYLRDPGKAVTWRR